MSGVRSKKRKILLEIQKKADILESRRRTDVL